MRWLACTCIVAIIMATTPGRATAQDQSNNPEELNRKYQEAVAQLKAAQDRKNELATENEKLTAQIVELKKQLADAKSEAVAISDKTFVIRLQYAAFQEFLRRHGLEWEWKRFVERSPLTVRAALPDEVDPTRPLSAE